METLNLLLLANFFLIFSRTPSSFELELDAFLAIKNETRTSFFNNVFLYFAEFADIIILSIYFNF